MLQRIEYAPLCCPSIAAPTRTQFVNDSSYSRVYAALGAGARAQGRAHLPELQLKVGHTTIHSIVHHIHDMGMTWTWDMDMDMV
jgi:hypothetical protein